MTDTPPQHFPAVFDYDDDIPADVLVRWTQLDGDRLVLADLGVLLATCTGFTISLIGAAGLIIGSIGTAAASAVLLLGLLTAVAALQAQRTLRRRSGLRRRDIDLVLAHRTEIRFESWNELAGRGWPESPWSEEARLAHRAGQAITDIQLARLWTEPDLLDHRLRLDLPETSRQIHVAAWQVHRLRRDVGPRPSGPGTDALAAEWDIATAHLDRSMQVLQRHVDAIDSYRHTVNVRNRELLLKQCHAQLRAQSDGAVLHLAAQDARQELATENLIGLRRELQRSTAE